MVDLKIEFLTKESNFHSFSICNHVLSKYYLGLQTMLQELIISVIPLCLMRYVLFSLISKHYFELQIDPFLPNDPNRKCGQAKATITACYSKAIEPVFQSKTKHGWGCTYCFIFLQAQRTRLVFFWAFDEI